MNKFNNILVVTLASDDNVSIIEDQYIWILLEFGKQGMYSSLCLETNFLFFNRNWNYPYKVADNFIED